MTRRGRLKILLIAVSSVICLTGCATDVGEDVAALVNGRPIKMEHLSHALHSSSGLQDTTEHEGKVIEKILEQLIEEELILQEAEKLKVNITQAELARKVSEIKADYPGQSFEEMLIKEYLLMDEWLESLKRSLLITKIIETEVKSRVNINPQEWQALYETHRSELIHPPLVRVEHITCLTKAEAEKALRRIRSGQDFGTIAQNYKDRDAGSLKEVIGWINPNNLPSELGQAILETKPGLVSEVVESRYGFTIFKVLEVKPARPMSLKEVEAYLHRLIIARQEAEILTEWIKELRANAKIKINPLLTSLKR
ncbi:MAG: peptidylprolyl isomerase [Deltaproteobacteria bacterium]|nr:peptidylprolyl isomerase [Deltaproteobacteria bacterium]MBW2085256.1 peptidylprolyl isomerase [Deltaproteobacteria bacterium]